MYDWFPGKELKRRKLAILDFLQHIEYDFLKEDHKTRFKLLVTFFSQMNKKLILPEIQNMTFLILLYTQTSDKSNKSYKF